MKFDLYQLSSSTGSPGEAMAMNVEDVLRIVAWPLLGAGVGAIITFLYNRRLAGVKTAIDLHSEFHSDSFLKSRIEADKALTRLVVEQKRTTISAIYKYASPEEWIHVSRVLHFFEKLTCLSENHLVHRRTCEALLGHYTVYFK